MGSMGSVFDYLWQRNSNQGSSLQQKWRFVSRRTNRDQRLPCGWVARVSLLQYYLLWFYIIPGPAKATPIPSAPPTAHPTTPLTSTPTPTPTPTHILRMISFFDGQICRSLSINLCPQLTASRAVALLIMVHFWSTDDRYIDLALMLYEQWKAHNWVTHSHLNI